MGTSGSCQSMYHIITFMFRPGRARYNDTNADVTILLVGFLHRFWPCKLNSRSQPSCLAARFHVCSLGRESLGVQVAIPVLGHGQPGILQLVPWIPSVFPFASQSLLQLPSGRQQPMIDGLLRHGIMYSVKVTMSFLIFHLQAGFILGWESTSLPREWVWRTCGYGCQPWLLRSFLPICMATRVASGCRKCSVLICGFYLSLSGCVQKLSFSGDLEKSGATCVTVGI